MADKLVVQQRGARIEMQKRHKFEQLPKTCASCSCKLKKSDWLRCNTCSNINICVPCTYVKKRHSCLDTHTFTAMFRIHELSLMNRTEHDSVLKKVIEQMGNHICNTCHQTVDIRSWVRCNDCCDFDLCMQCWDSSYHQHCAVAGEAHTFTNMTYRYRLMVAPTCAFLTDEEQSLALFRNVGIDMNGIRSQPHFDRAYCSIRCDKARKESRMHTCWTENWPGADAKLMPYYCPVGWRRFSLVATKADFDSGVTLYHGTSPRVIASIYKNGLKCNPGQYGIAAYVSPSITYCAHPRYARVVKMRLTDNQVVYAQFVVELRVNLNMLETKRHKETLSVGNEHTLDPNFLENDGLEILLCKEPDGSYVTGEDGVHMTGIMVRVFDHDPFDEAEAWWWTKCKSKDFWKRNCYEYESGVDADDDADEETFAVNDDYSFMP